MSNIEQQIEQFASDFGIEYESYKHKPKSGLVVFVCVNSSPSEVERWTVAIPDFIVGRYSKLKESSDD